MIMCPSSPHDLTFLTLLKSNRKLQKRNNEGERDDGDVDAIERTSRGIVFVTSCRKGSDCYCIDSKKVIQ